MVCINARNLKSVYSHRLKILPGDLASYQLSSLPQQVLRASVLLAFSSFPLSALELWTSLPTCFCLRMDAIPSPGLLISGLVLYLILAPTLPKPQPQASSQGHFHSLSQTGFPREGNIFLCCLWRPPQSSSQFVVSTKDTFLCFELWQHC